MALTLKEYFDRLPMAEIVKFRDTIIGETGMGKSTFYKIVAGEFRPKPVIRQRMADLATVPLQFKEDTVYPSVSANMKPSYEELVQALEKMVADPVGNLAAAKMILKLSKKGTK